MSVQKSDYNKFSQPGMIVKRWNILNSKPKPVDDFGDFHYECDLLDDREPRSYNHWC